MREAEDTTDRRVKWMRYCARLLAVIWAVSSNVALILVSQYVAERSHVGWTVWGYAPVLVSLAVLPWVSAILPWRWEAAGATALLVAGLIELTLVIGAAVLGLMGHTVWYLRGLLDLVAQPAGLLLLSTMALPLIAGMLLLKTSARSAWLSEKRRLVLATAFVVPSTAVAITVACMLVWPIFACLIDYFVICILAEHPPSHCDF